ncbi:MAG: leucine--tRNA ligase [Buchnera aphidicola (Meitanaphis flavogallis)]
MKKEYIPKEIENNIQKLWEKKNIFSVTENKKQEKYYCLSMIPYPSGKLHMGHVRNYTISDVVARYQRMIGKNVLHPMGWDAFGLPAEIAAIQNNVSPAVWTNKNISYMKKQLQSLGLSYDWNREITTCAPEYYKWEQWFFIELYKKKLVYKKKSWVNWCTTDQTILANEQVINGLCWRCNTKIIKKNISQWFIKITNYAEELLHGLQELPEWPSKVKKMQSNWIGLSHGATINLKLSDTQEKCKVYISQPEALMGATFIAISPFHKLVKKISNINRNVHHFIKKKSYLNLNYNNFEKNEGVNTEKFAFHPITKKKIPIWIANYVVSEYNTKAILGVPAHNQNDLDFAKMHNLTIKPVILDENDKIPNIKTIAMTKPGKLFDSEKYNNLHTKEGYLSIISELKNKKIGEEKTHYKLKDWGVSRQRYWGVPIPMATLENGEIIPIPEKYLPIQLLSKKTNTAYTHDYFSNTFKKKKININGKIAICESDTLDTFVESSWYYARYTCTKFNQGMINKDAANYWLPIDLYIGGIEHSIMHLIYFRFFHKLLRDFGLVQSDEPVKKLLCQGMVLSDAFYYIDSKNTQNWINIASSNFQYDLNGNIKKTFTYNEKKVFHAGMIKMSKSKKNGVEPEKMIDKYGADTVRLFIMFAAPVEASLEWKESGVKGMYRFLKKLWIFCYNHIQNYKHSNVLLNYESFTYDQQELYVLLHRTIQKVEDDISKKQSFNTAIAAIMKLVNTLFKFSSNQKDSQELIQYSLLSIIKILYPFTPHFSHTLLQYLLINDKHLKNISWPKIEKSIILNKSTTVIVIQINGKMRHKITITQKYSKKEILDKVLKEPKIFKYTKKYKISNIIYIPNKLINLIIHH